MNVNDGNYKVESVAIFGNADVLPREDLYKQTFDVAKVLAENGYEIVNGGGPGVMEAATNGAESVDGKTLTVTLDPKYAPGFEEKYLGNRADVTVSAENYFERTFGLVAEGDFFVVMNGGTGTLSELGMIWCLARLYKGSHKGFVLYGDFWKEVVDVLMKHMRIRSDALEVFEIVNSPEEVLAAIGRYEEKMKGGNHIHPDAGSEAAFMVGHDYHHGKEHEDH